VFERADFNSAHHEPISLIRDGSGMLIIQKKEESSHRRETQPWTNTSTKKEVQSFLSASSVPPTIHREMKKMMPVFMKLHLLNLKDHVIFILLLLKILSFPGIMRVNGRWCAFFFILS
jgi:hypothetical protein